MHTLLFSKPSRDARSRCAAAASKLGLHAPFTPAELGDRLEAHTGRAVRLTAAVMDPGGPSGLLLRTRSADHIFCEARTSAFHQLHIVLTLAYGLLAGEEHGPVIDHRLVPDLDPQLVRMILGEAVGRPVAAMEAEAFAFLVLSCAGMAHVPRLQARRTLRQLQPLSSALADGVRDIGDVAAPGDRGNAAYRLYKRVIEIRDAMLSATPPQGHQADARTAPLPETLTDLRTEAACLAGLARAIT